MADVFNPVVAAYVLHTVGGWLFANAGVASGALLVAVMAMLRRRSRAV